MEKLQVVAIGAANVDINGYSATRLIKGESNPGRITLCAGGVARNVAENLARLGARVELISALGGDGLQRLIIDSCKAAGVGYSHCAGDISLPSSSYLAILDEDGELVESVCDMSSTDILLTPETILQEAELIASAEVIVVDAGLLHPTLSTITQRFADRPIFLDPVSIKRCVNLEGLLPRFHTVKMNANEASHLAGVAPTADHDALLRMAEGFLAQGIARVYITMGGQGAVYAERGDVGWVPAVPVPPVGVSGAGDSFLAGVIVGHLEGWTAAQSAAFASGVAAVTLSSPLTTNPDMSRQRALDMMNLGRVNTNDNPHQNG